MCTNFRVDEGKPLFQFARRARVDASQFIISAHHKPADNISIVRERIEGGEVIREVVDAILWLYLQQTPQGLKPHPDFFSVNSNHKKLPTRQEYRRQRCIIVASGFMESQGGQRPHYLTPENGQVMAFGGLYRNWTDSVTGQFVTSAAIITLASHPAMEHIHDKSIPLWLPKQSYDDWLNPQLQDTSIFNELLTPHMLCPLKATPIDRISSQIPIGEAEILSDHSKSRYQQLI